jgi:hypothetical protein
MLLVRSVLVLAGLLAVAAPARADVCVDCHRKVTPGAVTDWELSKHSKSQVDCAACHGDGHKSAADVAMVRIPTLETCAGCHAERVVQFKKGKHAAAWIAMRAMPSIHFQPMALTDGQKGCGGCHKIGIKTPAEIKELSKAGGAFGIASCDSCHTRHVFSVAEARQPQACQTCHMGFDHPQWEMYSSSKHGVRYMLRQTRAVPATVVGPSCQTCHMQEGNHEVRTAWGFLAVRLPMPEDKQWAADRTLILQALGVLDVDARPTARLGALKAADIARFTPESWQAERDKMIATCRECHSANFAKAELAKGDDMIKAADHLMAEAIRVVYGLYQDGTIVKPKTYPAAFPDLLTFHDAPTVIEQRLFVMFLEHRMRTFQGTFHASPDYALWYGWSEMVRDVTEIKEIAADLRALKGLKPQRTSAPVKPPAAVPKK